jgi:hypothetical protein
MKHNMIETLTLFIIAMIVIITIVVKKYNENKAEGEEVITKVEPLMLKAPPQVIGTSTTSSGPSHQQIKSVTTTEIQKIKVTHKPIKGNKKNKKA